MPQYLRSWGVALLLVASAIPLSAEDLLQLRDGDRVVLLGSTLIEREQSYGYWETALYAANPGISFSVRNLGWSGDTVWAESRAGFGTPDDGFNEMQTLVKTLNPTLVIVAYGFNESFAGEQGIPKFTEGLKRLLDMLYETKTRLVLVSPPLIEYRTGHYPNPAQHNQNIILYRNALREFARAHYLPFADWTDHLIRPASEAPLPDAQALTDDGLHLTETGYRKTANTLAALTIPENPAAGTPTSQPDIPLLEVDLTKQSLQGFSNTNDQQWSPQGFHFTGVSKHLPLNFTAGDQQPPLYRLKITGLQPEGNYRLSLDDREAIQARGTEWEQGVALPHHPDRDQLETLRQTILRKNELFFTRWRPQNVTYLFGFRKHEQGQNAKEVAEFEPLVQEQDRLIEELKQPRPHLYQLLQTP